jgi:hypothetical protein
VDVRDVARELLLALRLVRVVLLAGLRLVVVLLRFVVVARRCAPEEVVAIAAVAPS